ncbi:DUF655 domain-containing protein [Candidatus Woesearchaeota archaeon]|nr:DUF655 domain-containing protein [Candidatus Woesearchaeota archaeon]
MIRQNIKEEFVIVIDFLPNGYPFDTRPLHQKTPIAQAIGKNHFVLLELVPKRGVTLNIGKEVYIGEGKREEIHHIIGKLDYNKLTNTAKSELDFILKDVVEKDEKRFVDFFNKSQAINKRIHQLELLPGIGKKHMMMILEARDEKEFESFKDIKDRVKLLPDPEKAIIRRILVELNNEDRYKLFTEEGGY